MIRSLKGALRNQEPVEVMKDLERHRVSSDSGFRVPEVGIYNDSVTALEEQPDKATAEIWK